MTTSHPDAELQGVPPNQAAFRTRPATVARTGVDRTIDADVSRTFAAWTFGAFVVVAFPLILFKLDTFRWFPLDEWHFFAARDATSVHDLFTPYNGHWSTVPIIVFRILWKFFGVRTYVPYEACVVGLHLTACVLLRVVMRRAGVAPWIATAAAGAFVLFGPGEENIGWAFQIGFTGALVFGLTQLVLADHEGGIDWRDGLAIGAGALSLMSSGVGVTMAIAVGASMFLRRGWRIALLQAGPLAVMYTVWWRIEHPALSTPYGHPSTDTIARWIRSATSGVFVSLGHVVALGVVLGVLLGAGFALGLLSPPGPRAFLQRAALPIGMAVGALSFMVTTAWGRWLFGQESARTSRYLHILVALTLPALAIAADAFVRRWRILLYPLAALFAVAIPWNASAFDNNANATGGSGRVKEIVTNVVRMPFIKQVSGKAQPLNDLPMPHQLTVSFLLDAVAEGKLHPATGPISPSLERELQIRAGVSTEIGRVATCVAVKTPLDLVPAVGSKLAIASRVDMTTRNGSQVTSMPVHFDPIRGNVLTFELPDVPVRLTPPRGAQSFSLCGFR